MTDISFTHVTCIYDDYCLISAVEDERAEDNEDHAIVYNYDAGDWFQLSYDVAICGSWRIADPDPLLVSVGVEGSVFLWEEDTSTETVDDSEDGPTDLVTLRCGAVIDGDLYAAGMLRQMYHRRPGGNWTRIDANMRLDPEIVEDGRGFLSIAGRSSNSIYAAGYAGEIWAYDGSTWVEQESPTNVALTAIAVGDAGRVCIVGQLGTIVLGHVDAWSVLEQEMTEDDLWAAAFFKGHFYVASSFALYRIVEDELIELQLSPESDPSFGQLSTNGGILWSVGEKDIMQTTDGENWEVIEPP